MPVCAVSSTAFQYLSYMGLSEVGGKPNFPYVGPHRDGSGINRILLQHAETPNFIILVTILKNNKFLSLSST